MFLIRLSSLKKPALFVFMYLAALQLWANSPFDTLKGKQLSVQIELIARINEEMEKLYPRSKILELFEKESVIAEAHGDNKQAYLIRLWILKREKFSGADPLIIEKGFLSIIDKITGSDLLPLKLFAFHLLADHYWNYKDYGRSFEYEFRAFDIYKDLDFEEYPEMRMYYFQLAGRYYGFRDYQNTKRLLLSIPENSLTYDFPGPELYYNLLGLCYRHMEQYDSAIHYLKKGQIKALEKNNLIYDAIIQGNIGISYYYQKKFNEAIPLLEKDIRYCTEKNRALENAAKSLAVLADVYFQLGNTEKASSCLSTSLSIVRRGYSTDLPLMEFVYPFIAKVEAKQGNFALAYQYMDSARLIKDSLHKEKSTLILARAQNLVAAQTHLAEIRQLNDQKKIQVLIRNSLLIGVILLGLVTLLFINRQKIANRRRQEKLESEKQLVAAELSNAEMQLQMFTKRIHEKNALIEQFSAQLESMQPAEVVDLSINYEPETMIKLRESTILTDEEWENFRKLFERVHSGFLERLRIKIPGLSPAETRFIALTKLRLSNKEMAGTLGISTDAVRMNKHRLRKKLNLGEDATIEELIETL